ncbi:MAG: ABC transporter substrate-binding protein [Propionibacteriaceae bacterium]|nr:ABC transporter substrate-binding protein [Propionibacteriaceae bacterium]
MKIKNVAIAVSGIALALSLAACGGGSTPTADTTTPADGGGEAPAAEGYNLVPKDIDGDGYITLGFAQVGAESGWRTANTQSYKDYFVEANGFKLIFADANQDADKQKQDVRDLITQGAEVIDLAPVTDSGWEPILEEAKAAGIPLIVSDRQLSVSEDLYLTYFGGDMEAEGNRAVEWLTKYMADNSVAEAKIVHLQGTIGSTAQKGRSKALDDAVAANANWSLVAQQTGEFTQAKGQEVMESILQQNADFNVIYSENDDMTYGAIDALTAAGKKVEDYIIISFDGNKSAVQMVIDGKIDVIAECDPLLGPQVGDLIKKAAAGETIAKITYSVEGVIDSSNAAEKITVAFGS